MNCSSVKDLPVVGHYRKPVVNEAMMKEFVVENWRSGESEATCGFRPSLFEWSFHHCETLTVNNHSQLLHQRCFFNLYDPNRIPLDANSEPIKHMKSSDGRDPHSQITFPVSKHFSVHGARDAAVCVVKVEPLHSVRFSMLGERGLRFVNNGKMVMWLEKCAGENLL